MEIIFEAIGFGLAVALLFRVAVEIGASIYDRRLTSIILECKYGLRDDFARIDAKFEEMGQRHDIRWAELEAKWDARTAELLARVTPENRPDPAEFDIIPVGREVW